MSGILFYVLAFVPLLGVLIIVHEYGHYLVARLVGVKVLRFSVGFGRALWSIKIGPDGTEWSIGMFPSVVTSRCSMSAKALSIRMSSIAALTARKSGVAWPLLLPDR